MRERWLHRAVETDSLDAVRIERDVRQRQDEAAAAAVLPSVRCNVPAGTIIIRDAAMWHRAMPNMTSEPREMLSFAFAPVGGPATGIVVGRPLKIAKNVLDALPAEARAVWAVNELV